MLLCHHNQSEKAGHMPFKSEKFINENTLHNATEIEIDLVCREMAQFLIEKNRAYGNSALDPVRIFSKSDNIEQLMVRIDDKLSRFARGREFPGDNDVDDLLGYLVLLKVARRDNWR